jgi:hypothetical protein
MSEQLAVFQKNHSRIRGISLQHSLSLGALTCFLVVGLTACGAGSSTEKSGIAGSSTVTTVSSFSSVVTVSSSSLKSSASSVTVSASSVTSVVVSQSSKSSSVATSQSSSSSTSSIQSSKSSSNNSSISIVIQPKSIALRPGDQQQFSCSGATNLGCSWKIEESSGGQVSPAGVYVAPAAPGVYHLTASSVDDPGATATATVTVTATTLGACNDLPAVGTWENITPIQLNAGNWCVPGSASCSSGQLGTYGTNAFVVDPINSGTVYLGTSSLGIWKTTNCGSTWVKINTGRGAYAIDQGRNWSMIIDPTNSQVLYTVTGYAGAGFYKSIDGGVNWDQKFSQTMLDKFPGQGIEKISMDPTNNQHLTATFHNPCLGSPNGGGEWPCIAETMDGGETFTLTNSPQFWSEGDGQTMLDEKTWFFSTGGGQIWRTTNSGHTWDMVYDGFSRGDYNSSGCIYTATDGTLYTGGSRGMVKSTNRGETWQVINGAPQIGGPNGNCPMVDDGTNFYVSMGLIAYEPPTTDWFYKSSNPANGWTGMNNPPVITGGLSLQIDKDHMLLYSSNSTAGFFRVVLKKAAK